MTEVVAGGGAVGVSVTVTIWPSVIVVAEMYGVGIHVEVAKVDDVGINEELAGSCTVDDRGFNVEAVD